MQGEANARIVDFHKFLVGDGKTTGLLCSLDLPFDTIDYSEETCRRYAHRLGFESVDAGFGCFSDEHESPQNRLDRHGRFLPEHDRLWASSVNQFEYKGIVCDVDDRLCDEEGNDLISARRTLYKITDADGNKMMIDMGGIVPLEGIVYLFASHDESCFAAGDFESKVTTGYAFDF